MDTPTVEKVLKKVKEAEEMLSADPPFTPHLGRAVYHLLAAQGSILTELDGRPIERLQEQAKAEGGEHV